MQKKITFFMLNNRGTPTKQATVSKTFLIFLGSFLVFCLISAGFVIYDYYNLKQTCYQAQILDRKVSSQLDEIAGQREQIQRLSGEINTLKSKLVDLNSFEKKIRIIANIEKTDEQDSLFGVGGSMPEDIDTNTAIQKKHNGLLSKIYDPAGQLHSASIKQEEGVETLFQYFVKKRNLLACTPSIRPTEGPISSNFGYRISPFTGLREFNKGLNIAAQKGIPVKATADGIITYASAKGFLGKLVVINHGHGIVTRYAHLSKILKKQGDNVKKGEAIAWAGNTGQSTGPHVHYEVCLNGIPVNPEKYILN